jgi:hypothetical protein
LVNTLQVSHIRARRRVTWREWRRGEGRKSKRDGNARQSSAGVREREGVKSVHARPAFPRIASVFPRVSDLSIIRRICLFGNSAGTRPSRRESYKL